MKFNVIEAPVKSILFSDVNCGELFTDADGDFMMKTESVSDDYDTYNAVSIKDGKMYPISHDYPVTLIDKYDFTLELSK